MNITLLCTGKTSEKYVFDGIGLYADRLKHYAKFNMLEVEAGQGDVVQIKKKESETILKKLGEKDVLILLDEKGKELSSVDFAKLLTHYQNISTKNLAFVIGGAYGFSEKIYSRANMKLSLSKMTFPHQLVRVIFLEQLYRAFTIQKGEKYHH